MRQSILKANYKSDLQKRIHSRNALPVMSADVWTKVKITTCYDLQKAAKLDTKQSTTAVVFI